MNAKNALTALCSALIFNLAACGGAYAATTQRVYSSGILVLVFIGFVALVVVVQLIPAIITLVGMLRGLAASRKKDAAESATR